MAFTYWAISHGVHYDTGLIMRYKLIIRQREFERLMKEWKASIIWC